jgi:hypothetical protein
MRLMFVLVWRNLVWGKHATYSESAGGVNVSPFPLDFCNQPAVNAHHARNPNLCDGGSALLPFSSMATCIVENSGLVRSLEQTLIRPDQLLVWAL